MWCVPSFKQKMHAWTNLSDTFWFLWRYSQGTAKQQWQTNIDRATIQQKWTEIQNWCIWFANSVLWEKCLPFVCLLVSRIFKKTNCPTDFSDIWWKVRPRNNWLVVGASPDPITPQSPITKHFKFWHITPELWGVKAKWYFFLDRRFEDKCSVSAIAKQIFCHFLFFGK